MTRKNGFSIACLFLSALFATAAQAATIEVTGTDLNGGRLATYASGDTLRVTGEPLEARGWETLSSYSQSFSLELVNGQTSIPNKAMYNNAYLTSLTANDVTAIGAEAFAASVLTSVYLPKATTVGEAAFASSNLENASLPEVRTVGNRAFSGCPIRNVSLPSATEIGDFAFNNCSRLTTVSLPVAAAVGVRAFYGSALTGVALPKATSAGNESFSGCSSLAIASLPMATAIGARAFDGCVALKELHLDDADPTTGADAFRNVPSGLLIYTNNRSLKGTTYPDGYKLVTPGKESGGGCNSGLWGWSQLSILTALAAAVRKRGA
jgi:hypothetical protein